MNRELFESYYQKRGFSKEEFEEAVIALQAAESTFIRESKSFENVSVEDVRAYLKSIRPIEINTYLALARYFYLINQQDVYIYFTSLLGGRGVIENIISSLETSEGPEVALKILEGFDLPAVGMEPTELPEITAQFMNKLESALPESIVKYVLAGNNHGIPKEAYLEERALYRASKSLDDYLADYQKRQIQILQEHCDQNKVWFEQKITQEVIYFAASNQEIMSAVRCGQTLYTTKIPYDAVKYLQETDPKLKRYYACHCPFAREAILNDTVTISSNWCYCSGGFAKFPYEIILDQPLRVECIASVLKGDDFCRFAVHLDDSHQ